MAIFITRLLQSLFGIHIPAVFGYTSTRILLACATSIFVTLIFGSRFIKWLYEFKIGQQIRDDAGFLLGQLHKNKKNTPTMGGGLILFSVMVAELLWMDLSHPFTWILFFTILVLGGLGGYDDYLKLRYKNAQGLSAKKKLVVQLMWAILVVAYMQLPCCSSFIEHTIGLKAPLIKLIENKESHILSLEQFSSMLFVPFFKDPVYIFTGFGLIALWLFLIFVIVGASNAVNLTDGLDGLASGLSLFVAATLGVFAFLMNHLEVSEYLHLPYIEGAGEVAIFLAALGGACLGFLWYNGHPAQVFMGDIGSLSIGGLLGVSSVLLGREFLLGLAGAIFVMEALSVIIQVISYRFCNKRRIFLCAPLHHHFEYLGWSESKVVIRFWIIGFILSIMALCSIKFQ